MSTPSPLMGTSTNDCVRRRFEISLRSGLTGGRFTDLVYGLEVRRHGFPCLLCERLYGKSASVLRVCGCACSAAQPRGRAPVYFSFL